MIFLTAGLPVKLNTDNNAERQAGRHPPDLPLLSGVGRRRIYALFLNIGYRPRVCRHR
jgi:hypothetical protein